MYSGILLAFELIGVRVKNEPFSNFKIELLSPEALPFVFITLILYYGTRYKIEWHQSSEERRLLKASRIDYWLSHGIAILTILVFGVQRLTKVQIAGTSFLAAVSFTIFFLSIALYIFWISSRARNINASKNSQHTKTFYKSLRSYAWFLLVIIILFWTLNYGFSIL